MATYSSNSSIAFSASQTNFSAAANAAPNGGTIYTVAAGRFIHLWVPFFTMTQPTNPWHLAIFSADLATNLFSIFPHNSTNALTGTFHYRAPMLYGSLAAPGAGFVANVNPQPITLGPGCAITVPKPTAGSCVLQMQIIEYRNTP